MTRRRSIGVLGLFMVASFTIIYFREPSDVRKCLEAVEDIDDEAIRILNHQRGYESFPPLSNLITAHAQDLPPEVESILWSYVEALQEAEAAFGRNDRKAYAAQKKVSMQRMEVARGKCRDLKHARPPVR